MADENWQKVREIFDDALRQNPEERRKFVRRACGKNKTLLADVESLLASLDSAESFMEQPAIAGIAGQMLSEDRQFSKGQFLNHYEIIRQIGAGGMGDVYLAQDTKLARRVALKILRENLLSDKHANRRLLREAQAAALLEHPNICAIYEISETADCSFIVMQYVEGETLARRLFEKPLTTEESLDLAIQIADALSEAHARGIIHRDIKPANIIINQKGQAKVLDFGLAKILEAEEKHDSENGLPSSGSVMGTVPFMSPEQLCGKKLDARTDIFSFGALFYEMLTGRQAFAGESNAERISAILNDQPDFEEMPEILQPIVQKCLMKKRDERYQTAQELMCDLLDAKQNGKFSGEVKRHKNPDVQTTQPERVSSSKKARPFSKSPRFYFWKSASEDFQSAAESEHSGGEVEIKRIIDNPAKFWLFALGVFIILGAVVYVFRNEIGVLKSNLFDQFGDSRQFDNLRPVLLDSWKTAGGFYTDYSLSHNGKLIAYSSSQEGGNEGIFVRQASEGEEIRVTKDRWTNISPIWSPDDQQLAYTSRRDNQSGIYITPALGGAAVPLKIIGLGDIRLRHWSKDGTAIFYELNGNLYRVEKATQESFKVTDFADAAGMERYFGFSPEEDRIAFCDKTDGKEDIWIMALKSGEKTRLTDDGSPKRRPRWHPDGKRIIYNVERDNFQQIGLAFTDGRPPAQITRGDSQYEMIDVSEDGTKIFYSSIENRSDISGVRIDTGEEFEVANSIEYENWSEFSPDGKFIAYQTQKVRQITKSTIILKQFNNPQPVLRIEGFNPRWLPDSRRVSFLRWSAAEQKFNLFVVNIDSGEEKQLSTISAASPTHSLLPMNRGELNVIDFAADSKNFVYISNSPRNVWLASLESGENVNLTKNENPSLRYSTPIFSADGKRFVFIQRENVSGKMNFSLWLRETDRTRRLLADAGGLRLIGWIDDEILLEMTDGIMSVAPLDVKLLRITLAGESRLVTVFKDIYAGSMRLSPNGKTVAFIARQNNKDDLWTASSNGGEPKKITANSATRLYYASPAWSPDGRMIYFDKQEQIETISMFENFK